MDLFDSRVPPLKKHEIRCTHQKGLASTSSALLKDMLNMRTAPEAIIVIHGYGRAETTFKLCVKTALVIHRHKPPLNIQ